MTRKPKDVVVKFKKKKLLTDKIVARKTPDFLFNFNFCRLPPNQTVFKNRIVDINLKNIYI